MTKTSTQPKDNRSELTELAQEILAAPKYHKLGIPPETVVDLLVQEHRYEANRKALVKSVRRKLHNIMAPYLENLDYRHASAWLDELPDQPQNEDIRVVCERIMQTHASTRERLPFLGEFYQRIFAVVGRPGTILDLACGLHPFSFPWMELPASLRFYAYDIHRPRIELIQKFFGKLGMEPLAEVRDVLLYPPEQPADIALLFKEAHRMEKRQPGCSRALWVSLRVRYLLVSLPSVSLHGSHDLEEKHRSLVLDTIAGLPWTLTELIFPGEIVYVIDKGEAANGL